MHQHIPAKAAISTINSNFELKSFENTCHTCCYTIHITSSEINTRHRLQCHVVKFEIVLEVSLVFLFQQKIGFNKYKTYGAKSDKI